MRRINTKLLQKYIDKHCQGNIALFAVETKLSFSLITKILAGNYDAKIRPVTRDVLCSVTGFGEDELFPDLRAK